MEQQSYQPLVDYLAASTEDEVHLSFPELERMLGFPLPHSAYGGRWWDNQRRTGAARALRAAGWRADARYIRTRMITFTRRPEGTP